MSVHLLKMDRVDTPLGPMVAIGDEEALYLLEFIDRIVLERRIESLRIQLDAAIERRKTGPVHSIQNELRLFFEGRLNHFQTPLKILGSDFQKSVWMELQKIPLGQTRSYLDLAKAIENPKAVRAVARANGANLLNLVIPCHRVIQSNGELGGYGGGVMRKKWLLLHEMEKNHDY
jgi:AraC family transcriptional regulator of adaptative response/methylated-DNA-[protein]-cysteine methyltransferase